MPRTPYIVAYRLDRGAIDRLDQDVRSTRIGVGDEVEGVVEIGNRLPGPANR